MIEMQRRDVLADLDAAADEGSLLIIGGPGSGKTWLSQQFVAKRKERGEVVVFLYAEDHVADSLMSLQQSLGVTDFIGALKAKTGAGNFLVIDALDALRAEASQRAFRKLIAAVQHELPAWKVVASIRTFDATESVEFHQLFPPRGAGIAQSMAIPARNLLVPSLSNADMAEAAIQDPRLQPLFRSGSPRLLAVLRNPFNLWLAIQLLDSDVHIDWFSAVQSDVQLLDRYWSFRVGGHETGARRSKLLAELTEAMVDRNSLTLSAREVLQHTSADAVTFSELLGNEVLRRSSTGRVSYSHNILFDFAVSKLLVDESNFLRFLTRTPAHSIFYRPSFAYFLTRLWFQERDLFWITVAPLIEETRDSVGRLSVIPALVIFESAENDDDLRPLFRPDVLTRGTVYVLRAIQACNGLTTHKAALWIRFLHELSLAPREAFINEFIALVDQAAQIADGTSESELVAAAARAFLRWMWAAAERDRPKNDRDQFTSIAAARVLPVVLRLFAFAPQEAREVVLAVLARLGTANASTNEPYWLTHSMEPIIENDPELAATVYADIFAYEESSQDKTSLGGPVFSMTSTRAQDYSMAYYILGTKFPLLLRRDMRLAARAMTQAITGEVERREGQTVKKLGAYNVEATLFGVRTRLESDRSEIWDQGYRAPDTTEQFVSTIMSEIAQRVEKQSINEEEIRIVFREMATFNKFPVLWKRVLEFVKHNPALLRYVLPLLTSTEILAAPETTVAAGNVIRLAFEHEGISVAERHAIEASILSIPNLPMAKDAYRDASEIRNRLLGCIPRQELGPEAVTIIEHVLRTSQIPENRPFFKIGPVTSGVYTGEDWLRDQGVHPDSEDNRKLLNAQQPLKIFENKYLNQIPPVDECVAIISPLRNAFELVLRAEGADMPVITQVFATVVAVAEEILKSEDLGRESEVVQLCREIVFAAAKHPHPVPELDADASFDHAVWGSSPKIEAAQGAMHYAWCFGLDDDLRLLITTLAQDPAPEVRFQVAALLGNLYRHDASFYWRIMDARLHRERALGVLDALVRSLVFSQIARTEQRKVVEHLAVLLSDGIPPGKTADSITQVAIDSLAQFSIYFNNADADIILRKLEEDAAIYHNELSYMASAASHYILYEGDGAIGICERARNMFVRVIDSVDHQFEKVLSQPVSKDSAENEKRGDLISKLLKVIDSAVFRLYIVLDANPQLRQDERKVPTSSARAAVFRELSVFWDRLAEIDKSQRGRPLAPATMHHLMEIFNAVVSAEPVKVLMLASTLLKGPRLGYEFDQMAITQVVQLTETLLADHREILSDGQNAARLGDIIDVFVSAGWPQATRLVMRLDSAIR